jgi:hypothetical protein
MEGSEPMGAWGSGTTFSGSPGSAFFVFAFVSTMTSEVGLEIQPERAANKQSAAILKLRHIFKRQLIYEMKNFQSGSGDDSRAQTFNLGRIHLVFVFEGGLTILFSNYLSGFELKGLLNCAMPVMSP